MKGGGDRETQELMLSLELVGKSLNKNNGTIATLRFPVELCR